MAIDVGIKNLAICIMSRTTEGYKVIYWKCLSVLEPRKCPGVQKNGVICNKICSVRSIVNQETYCKRHIPAGHRTRRYQPKSEMTWHNIANGIHHTLNVERAEWPEAIDTCLIELQPKINQRMKFVSHIIFGYMASTNLPKTLKFVRASKKLKAYKGPEPIVANGVSAYKRRKNLAVKHVEYFLDTTVCGGGLDHEFRTVTKKDDLSDAFLMAYQGF